MIFAGRVLAAVSLISRFLGALLRGFTGTRESLLMPYSPRDRRRRGGFLFVLEMASTIFDGSGGRGVVGGASLEEMTISAPPLRVRSTMASMRSSAADRGGNSSYVRIARERNHGHHRGPQTKADVFYA